MWRAAAMGVSVVVAAASGVVTAFVTTHPSRGLWVALGVVVIIGAVLQAAVTYNERRKSEQVEESAADVHNSQGGKYTVYVRDSPGPQIGDYNVQENIFPAPPADRQEPST